MAYMKSKGEVYEGVAFQFCKVATVSLLAGRYTLPVAALMCALFYALAYAKGKKDTRCIGRYPLAIAAFWLAAGCAMLWWLIDRKASWW
ncbi:MAG: hypothetical protein AKCLJLPJ_01609 [Fimbriimonadales bacterium]|nr:hypothetical protein [Fimbriimonadales bacterium]